MLLHELVADLMQVGYQGGSPSGGYRSDKIISAQCQLTDAVRINVDNLPDAVHFAHPVKQVHRLVMDGNDARADDFVLTATYHVVDFKFLPTKIAKVVSVIGYCETAEGRDQCVLLLRREVSPLGADGQPGHERQADNVIDHRLEPSVSLGHRLGRTGLHGLEERCSEGLYLTRCRITDGGIRWLADRHEEQHAKQHQEFGCHGN